jgi:hypothetical protein
MMLYIFNRSLNLYANIFQGYLKIVIYYKYTYKIGQLGINYFPVYMIYYSNLVTSRVENLGPTFI